MLSLFLQITVESQLCYQFEFGAVENYCALMLIGLDLMTPYLAEDGLQLSFVTWTGLISAILREAVV